MTTDHLPTTLPIRRWLALALAGIFIAPALALLVIGIIVFRDTQGPRNAADVAVSRLSEDAGQWRDTAWQAATARELAAEGIDFVLFEDGQEIYRSTDNPLAGEEARLARQVMVSGNDPERTAVVYSDQVLGPPEELRDWFVPAAVLGALLVTLGTIAWFLGRTVIAPLTATSDAARQVAMGDLDIDLPASRVREVAELNNAFVTMSADLRQSLQQQAKLEEERRLFVSAIAHDLRTPLFSLRGSLEGLERGVADTPEKQARYIGIAQDKATELERLISDLFTFSRLEYLEQAPDRERLDLAALLSRLVEGMRPQAEAKGVQLVLDGSPAPCMVVGDDHLLTRAVGNLLDNAVRHTPEGGTIRVEWHGRTDDVELVVSDTGPGIPDHDLPNLFTALYRGEQSRNRRTGGAGLGLTIARRILTAHGGNLTAHNGASVGAVFTGSLPRLHEHGTNENGPASNVT